MTRNKGKGGFDGPVAFGGMNIGMANPAGFGLDQDLVRPRRGHIKIFKDQLFAKSLNDGSLHSDWRGSARDSRHEIYPDLKSC